ncbi:primary-amine oxidase [Nocardia yamanashiensis]|uniref:primary-amine oxidase n=1 Tax=Nocardia yamanashiensis TaxID=209247 RepID=UPI001E38221E|nr:primary-amine oxidase [Nocardia yamanashiensis]UGT43440.1 primary-amine oxidase [Nocardia yamanashiensis]
MSTVETARTAMDSVLAALDAAEIDAVREILSAAGLVGPTVRFVYVGLDEPDKAAVLAHHDGAGPAPERLARILLLDISTGVSRDVLVSLTSHEIRADTVLSGSGGRVPILEEEFAEVGVILAGDESWCAALRARGVDPAATVCVPLSAGSYGIPGEEGRRIIRVFAFRQDHPEDHPWAHPVDGLCAYVDIIGRELLQLIDHRILDVPDEHGNFQDPALAAPGFEDLKPIEITQPDGPSFRVDGDRVEWANWRLQLGFDAREGLILRRLRIRDGERYRPVLYRASIAEMVVPYADPSPTRFWQNYFDTGEYLFGRFTNSLRLGCDCLGEIHYFDAVLSDELGMPRTIPNAICLHEEDYGTLWKHTDLFTGVSEVRRQRRLVISFFTTVGNYDYGFYWYLYLDGTIECEAKLTGVAFTAAYPPEGSAYQSEVAPGLGLPYHQHLFSARLDMMVDGVANAVDEVEVGRVPVGPDNPWGNAFTAKRTRLASEAEGARDADAANGRVWHIVSTEHTNRMGDPTAYVLHAHQTPTLLADPSSSIAARAAFTTRQLWVTRYAREERYPAGDLVNQHPGGDGLPAYMAANRSLDGEDLVLWHTFGLTHFPRPEDWPVMPVDYAGFKLQPYGFFDRNPVLGVPPSAAAHCCHPQ